MKKKLLLLTVLLGAGFSALAQFGPTYIYVGAAGFNATYNDTKVYYTNTPHIPGSFTYVSTVSGVVDGAGAPAKLNAIGLSCNEANFYGMVFPSVAGASSTDFYRVNPNTGIATKIGTLNAPPEATTSFKFINTTAGTLDQHDNYYFTAYAYVGDPVSLPWSSSNMKIYIGKITNVRLLPPGSGVLPVTYTEIDATSDAGAKRGMDYLLQYFDYTNPSNTDGGIEDISLNPSDFLFYTYMSYPNPLTPTQLAYRLMRISLATNKMEAVGAEQTGGPNREIAGCYFDVDGHFFVVFTDGQYTQVDMTTGAIMGLAPTPFPLADGNNLRGDLSSDVCVTPLPVELVSFTGSNLPNYNVLVWNTAKEENIKNITLERSANASTFESIASLTPRGSNSSYTYQDNFKQTAYYRLRFTNLDGSFELSPVVMLKRNGDLAGQQILVYPTTVNEAYFSVSGLSEPSIITVYSLDGKVLNSYHTDAAATQVPFNVSSGMYLITISDTQGHILATHRLVRK